VNRVSSKEVDDEFRRFVFCGICFLARSDAIVLQLVGYVQAETRE